MKPIKYLGTLKSVDSSTVVYATGGNPEKSKLRKRELKCVKLNGKYADKLSGSEVNIQYGSDKEGYIDVYTRVTALIDDSVDDIEFVYDEAIK